MQVTNARVGDMPAKKASPARRSGCPLNASVEMLGDRWSLLILRDIMLRGFRSYGELLDSYEGIENQALVQLMQKDKEQFLAGVRQRWAAQENACDRQLNFSPRVFPSKKSNSGLAGSDASLLVQRRHGVHARSTPRGNVRR